MNNTEYYDPSLGVSKMLLRTDKRAYKYLKYWHINKEAGAEDKYKESKHETLSDEQKRALINTAQRELMVALAAVREAASVALMAPALVASNIFSSYLVAVLRVILMLLAKGRSSVSYKSPLEKPFSGWEGNQV